MEYVKDDVPTVSSVAVDDGVGISPTRSSGHSSTKRETVMLPQISGEEKTAFLQYPIRKKHWASHISEYELKYRATMFFNHLDKKAKDQIVGFETEYEKAMEKL